MKCPVVNDRIDELNSRVKVLRGLLSKDFWSDDEVLKQQLASTLKTLSQLMGDERGGNET